MQYSRLFLVLVLTTAVAGLFGASVGGLLGYAVPSSLRVFFGVGAEELSRDRTEREAAKGTGATIALQPDRSFAAQGAALGGAFGLVLGAVIGVVLGVADQILTAIREAKQGKANASGDRVQAGSSR